MSQQQINIKNRKASYQYHLLDTLEAGIKLLGTEIKSIREGKASLAESYCYFKGEELFVKNMHIGEYSHGNIQNHEPLRERKLLLHKRELKKLKENLEKGGNNTIIPLNLFINENGLAKLRIALATGKKLYDKRESLRQKDMKREMDRRRK
jgi:SsrA-binding protein